MEQEMNMEQEMIYGRNAVSEALKSQDVTINQVYLQKDIQRHLVKKVVDLAKEKRIPIKEVPKVKLDQMVGAVSHQGIVAEVSPYTYCEIEDMLEDARQKGEKPFLMILDGIQDPHNLGSIIRSAECSGVHGIIIPKRHSVQVTATVVKVSAGATAHVKVARVGNINQIIEELKKNNIWIYGAEAEGEVNYQDENYESAMALVIGAEGKGLSKLTKELCDFRLRIPMKGQLNSLNASVAASVLMFQVLEKRMMEK